MSCAERGVHGILLAAGRGRRMGGAKHLLPVPRSGGDAPVPMLERVLVQLAAGIARARHDTAGSREVGAPGSPGSGAGEGVTVVLGSPQDRAVELVRCLGARFAIASRSGASSLEGVTGAPAPRSGERPGRASGSQGTSPQRSDSIRAGLMSAPDASGWLFAMCDQPLLTASDYARLLETFARNPEAIVCASYAGTRSTPTLFPCSLRAELLALTGNEGGRVVLARHPERIVRVELDPLRGRDLDTPRDVIGAFGPELGVDLANRPATMRPPMERTLSIIKPDAVGAQNTGSILQAIEGSGLKLVALRMLQLTPEQAGEFYAVHKERPFFKSLCDFMVSGPIVVSVLEGDDAIARYRKLMGATNPEQADPGTLRKQFATDVERNAVHGSDGTDTAAQEISFFFPDLR